MLLEEGLKYLQMQDYSRAVELLEEYCQQSANFYSPFHIQAKMALARAYRGNNQRQQAIALAMELTNHLDNEVSQWAKGLLAIFTAEEKSVGIATNTVQSRSLAKAGRAGQLGVKLALAIPNHSLIVAQVGTIMAINAVILAIFSVLIRIIGFKSPVTILIPAFVLTCLVNGVVFFLAPLFIDWTQKRLYRIRWVSLAEIKRDSPEAAAVVGRVCREKKLEPPKLGIIEDTRPLAFTYGSLRSNARLVVSRGLFTYLDDEEVATVYAHELGHIWRGDFSLMTVDASLVHLSDYIHSLARNRDGTNKNPVVAGSLWLLATLFRQISTFLWLYLSRTREYFADHFATEVTGNPNALARALVKIASGLIQQNPPTGPLLSSVNVLNIFPYQEAMIAGNVYPIALEPYRIGQTFLWELFNPWAKWLEFSSTHPLTGKRIRAMANYARQMNLDTEFGMDEVLRKGTELNRKKLTQQFLGRLCLYYAPSLGLIVGGVMAGLNWQKTPAWGVFSWILLGWGGGIMIKRLLQYPSLKNANFVDIFTLSHDIYINPLQGFPIKLRGELIGQEGDFILKDTTGIIPLSSNHHFGFLSQFLPDNQPLASINGESVQILGWFRRDLSPCLEWREIIHHHGSISGYPQFWPLVSGISLIILGLIIKFVF
jgi:Zn-dependent protease with chaperone function